MLRHRYTIWTQPVSSSNLTNVVSIGGASCVIGPTPFANMRLVDYKSMVDEVGLKGRKNNSCDSYHKTYFQPDVFMNYASSSMGGTYPWTSYCNWFGHVSKITRWWDTILPSGQTYGGSLFGSPEDPTKGLPVHGHIGADGTFLIDAPANIGDYITKSLDILLPGIKSEMSIPNTIMELRDIRSLKSTALRITNFINRIKLDRGGLSSSEYKKRTLRSLAKAASDVWLQKSFNIDPLLREFDYLRKGLVQVRAKISKILTEEGAIMIKRYQTPYREVEPSTLIGADWAASNNALFRLKREVSYLNPRFNATVEYRYRLSAFEREHAHVLGILDALGANWRPSIIWNALPWSFVVDWFVGVSRWLDNFQLRNIEPTVELYSYVWSVSWERRIDMSIRLNEEPQPQVAPNYIPTHSIIENYYKRVSLNSVTMYDSIRSSGLSLKELSLALALGYGRWG